MASLSEQFTSLLPVRYFRLFWAQSGARIVVVGVLAVVAGWLEALGIALLFPLFTAGSGAAMDSLSRSLSHVIDFFHVAHTPGGVLPVIVGLFVGKGVLLYLAHLTQVDAAERMTRTQRRRLLSALGSADFRHVAEQNAGFATNLLVSEVSRASLGLVYFVRTLAPALNAVVLFLVVLAIDWHLTVVCVGMGLVMIAFLRLSGGAARRHSRVATDESARMSSLVVQTFQAAKYLRATAGFDVFEDRVIRSSERVLVAERGQGRAGSALLAFSQPILILFLCGLLYYRAAVLGEPVASLFVVLVYFLRIMTELFMLQTSWQSFCAYMGSVDVVEQTIRVTEARREVSGAAPYAGIAEGLRCDALTFEYEPGRPVLRDVSLMVPRCTTVAFVGASGSGKSTLVDLMTGTLKPTAGSVRIDGRALSELDLAGLRRRIGYVPQEAIVFEDTVANNIALWRPNVDRTRIEAAARHAHAASFIEALPLGYEAPIGDRGTMLSGGQRQRLAIARELVKAPDVLVLDEATSALDSASERAIQASIEELRGTMTILLIAHRLSTVRTADRIYVLDGGRIAEEGTYDELCAAGGRFTKMVALQSLGERPPC